MKTAALTSLLVLSALVFSHAQFGVCTPDPSYQDSISGVFPPPFDPVLNPHGGIYDSACLNKKYQFVFIAVVGDTFNIGGIPLPMDSIQITDVTGLPEGFTFNCNTPNCIFLQNTLGCAVIYGIATNPADLGAHNLSITAKLFTPDLIIPVSFPNPFLPGSYTLYVLEENSPNCKIAGAFETSRSFGPLRILPNPFSSQTVIEIYAHQSSNCHFRVFDLMGRTVHNQNLQIVEGLNIIPFNGENLPEGLYLCSFTDGASVASGKMVVWK